MTANLHRYPKTGCLVISAFLFVGLLMLVMTRPGSRGYLDSAYQKDYEWKGIEVGTILRIPIGTVIPVGRKMAIVAFPTNDTESARILFEAGKGEVPVRPVFATGLLNAVTYEIPQTKGKVLIDLAKLEEHPLRSASSPKPILTSGSSGTD